MSVPNISTKKRLLFIFGTVIFAISILTIRLGWIQIVRGEKHIELANIQQTRDTPLSPERGTIFDRNGNMLSVSTSTFILWARPSEIRDADKAADVLSEILDLDREKTYEKITSRVSLVRIARTVDDDTRREIIQARIRGLSFEPDFKRNYPYGDFAAYILGHTSDDGEGIAGIEMAFNKYLKGTPGRTIRLTDGKGRQIDNSPLMYHPPENGLNVVLTIDEVIQHFTEKAVYNALIENDAKRVMAIVMEVKTGDILSMSVKPDYDPNSPRVPLDENLRIQLDEMNNDEKLETWFDMWRNPLINDTYEPGSTFKLFTTSAALEEDIATPDTEFYSKGYAIVGGRKIKSWRWYNPFGHQTLTEAVQNSDNPVFIELAQRMGVDTFYKYIDAFGFTERTGIDLPGERSSLMYNINNVGPVELATMSFGQSISITPIQLITATSAIANGGKLMQPRIVKELVDENNNVVHHFEEKMVRQVISEKTSQQMLEIMQSVVSTENKAYIPGYRIGGKTGTAQKVIDGAYAQGKHISSFVAVAPCDDPEIAVLIVIDEPNGYSHFGGVIATPVARDILDETLRYLDIKPKYSEEDEEKFVQKEVVVPDIRNISIKEASTILNQSNLNYTTDQDFSDMTETLSYDNMTVRDTFPKPGAKVQENSTIILYTELNTERSNEIRVPDLTGKTIREVNTILNGLGLKLKSQGEGYASQQSPSPNELVKQGTVVTVEFRNNINGNRN
ncbi:penicillin-binding transpeptidase domain-containing protein [Serpentinicella sp. ANB-PHB4]|uniref:penicillin-binding transpeptidase domain-containing protein n=1 Tax=Serpentinicella sp. ANB-PHB4 TaxID=3074076 RepID=UPI00285E06FA|nr:penicillin-binding transpeptidase domain-containing protein [Serpentinicella sp. ANB-PHB4]MDR5658026.1 penicillin-binding transpeptidase domain-containing protein [Serpentinicella sp. ANB-PHB4]